MAIRGRSFPIKAHLNYPGMLGIYANRQFSQTPTESLTLTETITKSSIRIFTESFSLTGVLTALSVKVQTLTESFSLTDILLRAVTKLLAEAATFTDFVLKASGRLLNESFADTDTVIKSPARVLTESPAITDVLTTVKGLLRTLTETFTVVGAISGTQGPQSPSTTVDDSAVGTLAWTNPNSSQASDNVYVTANTAATETTHYLKATNFGFAIPVGSTISGVLVEIERKKSGISSVNDSTIKLVKGGTVSGNNNSTGASWSTTESYVSFGSSSDLWGLNLTDADINDSSFGVVLSAVVNGDVGQDAFVDHIRITIYYSSAVAVIKILGAFLSEAATVTDVFVKATAKLLAESFTASLTFLKSTARTLIESFTATATVITLRAKIRELAESFSLTDTIQKAGNKVLSETATVADSILRTIARILTEPIILSDLLSKLRALILTDQFSLTDLVKRFLNGLLAIYSDKYTRRGNSLSDKYSTRGTSTNDKYTTRNSSYNDKYTHPQ